MLFTLRGGLIVRIDAMVGEDEAREALGLA